MEGLFRRGGVWHARLVVPARLRAIAGRREFIKSTGSRVLMTAKVAHAELMALWRRQLLELEDCKAVTDDEVRRLLNGSPALEMSEHLSILTAKDVTGIGIEALLTEAEAGRLDLLCRVPDGAARGHELSFDEWVNGKLTPANRVELGMAGRILPIFDLMGDSAATLLASGAPSAYVAAFDLGGGRIFVPDESALVPVERLVLRAVQVSALRHRWLLAVPLERRQTLGGSTLASTGAEQGQGGDWRARPFLEAMETYLTDPSGLPGRTSSPKEINQHRKALERFGEHCGNKPLGQFIDDDLRSFKRWVRTWPSGNLTGDLRRATWRETVAVAQAAGWPPITAGAAEERLTWVRQFFKWLHQRGRLSVEIGRSLAGEQDLTKAQQKDLARQRGAVQADGEVDDGVTRRPFSSAELALIFGQEQFRTGHGRHKAKGVARCDPHEYWVPLLALLHGLRPGEVCQLSLDCVRQVDGVWCLDINERDRDRSVKVTKRRKVELGARVVPLHPYAVELGLLKYHAALKATGQYRRLFPDLRWGGTDERYGKESGRKFTNLKNQLGLGREVSRHSFRHTANDVFARVELRGMDAGLQKIVRYEVIGHKVPAEDVNGVHYTHVSGAWSLDIPAGVAAGTTVCVSAAVPATSLATGANAGTGGGTAVPDGGTVTVGGVAYTYSRAAQRLRFATPANGTATMNFGEVPVSTFTAPGNRQGAVNTPVDHPHNFMAGTGGSLALSITGEVVSSNSANAIWSGTIYADPGCTGKVQTGAAQLFPGGATTPVVQGQVVCVVLREPVPANADNGAVNQATVKAMLTFTNASPALSASYILVDNTTVGNSALVLLKEVRNLTTGGTWGTSNQAKSGQLLEYRVTYTNTTKSPMTKVSIADTVPAYTTFQSATVGAVPNDLGTCTMNTPANPAPATAVACTTLQSTGGTGSLRWMFDGKLDPAATGDVSFKVKVD